MKTILTIFIGIFLFAFSRNLHAYPEDVRHGYASCKSCHYSPTGGGTLTPYGRRLSEEIQSTWGKENQADLMWGFAKTPDAIQVGGDFRTIAYKRETNSYRESRYFLMQADIELVAPKFWDEFTAAVNGGYYDEEGRLRRYYLMYDVSPNLSIRAGQFMPAFGINTPEHEIAIKRPLKFNEGSEVMSLELNYGDEKFEIFLTGFSGEKGEKRKLDTGASLTGAYYVGKSSKIGLNLYAGEGDIDERKILGAFAIVGFNEQLYLLSEIDYQTRQIKNKEKSLLEDEEGIFSYNKFGYEFLKGLHGFILYETVRADASDDKSFFDGYGGGLLWYPMPHFETQISFESTKNPGRDRPNGEMWIAMMHYYL